MNEHTPKNASTARQRHPFAPVYDQSSRLLILGSFPSVRSREDGFYYGHPRNRFWPMLARCLAQPTPCSAEEKRRFLLKNRLALWDVLAACEIAGSSDSSIRAAVPNDLRSILDAAPIERILCNGATAGKLFRRYAAAPFEPVILPSTSPANAAWSTERLCAAWQPWLTLPRDGDIS